MKLRLAVCAIALAASACSPAPAPEGEGAAGPAAKRMPLPDCATIEATDAGGLPVAGRGDVAAPLRIAVPAPGGGDITGEPLFWVGVIGGAAVIAGAIVLGVVLSNQATPNGTLVFTIDD